MEGAALAAKDRFNVAIVTAWHTAKFALGMHGGSLKGRKMVDFFMVDEPLRSKAAEALSFFQNLKARGVPVDISRSN